MTSHSPFLGIPINLQRRDGVDEYKITHLVFNDEGSLVAGYGPQTRGLPHGDGSDNFQVALTADEIASVTSRGRR